MDELSTEYDVIVVGTGMVESIVAAAVSRIGKKTLHIDRNQYYGQAWSTFNLEHFLEWIQNIKVNENQKENDDFKTYHTQVITDVEYEWRTVEKKDETEKIDDSDDSKPISELIWSEEKLRKCSRRFNLDLNPKLIFSKGPMVKLLLDSEVSKYVEFMNIANILVYIDSKIEPVPYSKSEVFSSRAVNVVEKRILMRILTQIQECKDDKFDDYKDKTFYEFLQEQKLSPKISKQILYSIAMVDENTPCIEGIKKSQYFLNSLGCYGNSPFLWTMYGTCDLLQAFCRLSAVHGGTYCLDKTADELIIENDKCKGVVSKNTNFHAEHVVIAGNELPLKFRQKSTDIYNRAILITDKSLFKTNKNGVSLLHFPVEGKPIQIIELDSSTSSCPKDVFVVHLTHYSQNKSYNELNNVIKLLFNIQAEFNDKPNVLFHCFFTMENISKFNDMPANIYPCTGPNPYDVDFHSIIDEAKNIFNKMYPEEEFFGHIEPQEEEEIQENKFIT